MASRYWVGGALNSNWAENTAGNTNWAETSGGLGVATVPGSTDDVFFDAASGSGASTISANISIQSLDCTGATIALTHNAAVTLTVAGSGVTFKLVAGMTYTLGDAATSAVTFTGTSGSTSITSGGKTFGNTVFNGVGGTWVFKAAYLSSGRITLTNGTLDSDDTGNGWLITCTVFSSSNSNTRVLTMGASIWRLTGSGTTIWQTSNNTGMTLTANTATIECTYSGSVGTRTINSSAASALRPNNLKVTAGTDSFTIANSSTAGLTGNLDFNGFSGTLTGSVNLVVGKNITFSATMTNSWTGTLNPQASAAGTYTLTFNGITLAGAMDFRTNNNAVTYLLADALVTTGAITMFNSTSAGGVAFNSQGNAITAASFSSKNSNTRTITLTGTTLTLTGTGTVWTTATATGLTLVVTSSLIKITDTSATDITFAGGGVTFNNLWFARGTSTAGNILTGANTFNDFKDDGSVAHAITFPNVTTTVTTFTVSGSAGQLITLQRTGGSGSFTLALATGAARVYVNYLSISNSTASPAASWFAGINSTEGAGNTGWVFQTPFAGSFFAAIL